MTKPFSTGHQVMRALVAVTTLLAVLGCSGVRFPFGPRWQNAQACRAYVATYNALECVADHQRLSASDNCPASLDQVPCDLGEHYACLIPRTECVNGTVDVSAHLECGDRSCN